MAWRAMIRSVLAALAFCAAGWAQAPGPSPVVPGELVIDPPTLRNLGFRWFIEGDANRRAEVAVRFREAGAEEWREGLPMLRIGGEVTDRPGVLPRAYVAPDMFGGSVLDLEPGTEYECAFEIISPDGVEGESTRAVTVRTRPKPRAAEDGRTFHVYPPGHDGPREEPSFRGLKEAYQVGGGDWAWAGERRLRPGDTVIVHPGYYKSQRHLYADPHRLPFHGTHFIPQRGEPDRPIVIRGSGEGEAIFDGDGAYMLFDLTGAAYIHFEDLTFRNAEIVFYAGVKHVAGADGLVVRNCRFEDVGIGIMAQYEGSKDFYISDNVFIGRKDPHRLAGWASRSKYPPAPLHSYYAVKVYGSGHVISHNYVAYFHDGITVCTHTVPDDDPDRRAVSIDIYNNDIHHTSDDFIEADGGVSNIRVMRNRGVGAGQFGVSAQPVYGGPVYFIRNIVCHSPRGGATKFQVDPSGLVVYHNTFLSPANMNGYSNGHFRNNLFLGRPGAAPLRSNTHTAYTTFDYNGYRSDADGATRIGWAAPGEGQLREYGRKDTRWFDSLQAFREATGQEARGTLVDYGIFRDVTPPDPANPYAAYSADDFDFRLRPGSAAANAGVRLPNVNDDYTGSAPDLGALELDRPLPVYGPRTQSIVGARR